MRAALIGYGAIGRMVVDGLAGDRDVAIAGILVRPNRQEAAREALAPEIAVCTSVDELIALKPELVAECAGQGAVRDYGEAILAAGIDLIVIATGALAEPELHARLLAAAERGGARILIPAGATAGLDGLGALKVGGLERVTYVSTKPPAAWKGTLAEAAFDLDALSAPTVLFEGRADEAALTYPQNANLAATIALAGAGFAHTTVRLVADPGTAINTGRIEAQGRHGHMTMEMRGRPMADNPKTSAVTALSVIRALRNAASRFVI